MKFKDAEHRKSYNEYCKIRYKNDAEYKERRKKVALDYRNENINEARQKSNAYKKLNKEKTREQTLKYKQSEKGRYFQIKNRCKRLKKVFELSIEQFSDLLQMNCYYCGTADKGTTGCGLDRIDNRKGYTIDNVLPSCGFCNMLRGARLSVEETKVATKAIIEYRSRQ